MSFKAPEPNKERLTLWAEALESGEFAQCTGSNLRIEFDIPTQQEKRSYCCLGVANEVAWRNGLAGRPEVDHGADMLDFARDWYGLGSTNPILAQLSQDAGHYTAIELNDNEGWTFTQIASAIRQRFGLPERSQLG